MVGSRVKVSEAEVKLAVQQYLQYRQNQGELVFLRLQSGEIIEVRGKTRRRVKLCPPGTYDFVVFQPTNYTLYHQAEAVRGCEPVKACRVTFLEIKSSEGKTTEAQDRFAEEAKKMNCRCFTIRDADQIEEILRPSN